MQMLVAAGYPVYWNRTPNESPANPRGYYELLDNTFKVNQAEAVWEQCEGKFVKIFPDRFQYLRPEKFQYRFIYLDRDPRAQSLSNVAMCKIEHATWGSHSEENLTWSEDCVKNAEEHREWALWVIEEYAHVVLQFENLYTGRAQMALGKFLGSTLLQMDTMYHCVDPSLKHF